MITINLDKNLEDRLEKFALANNTQIDVLIETILYEYMDDLDEKDLENLEEYDTQLNEFNQADISYLENSFGFKKKEDN